MNAKDDIVILALNILGADGSEVLLWRLLWDPGMALAMGG